MSKVDYSVDPLVRVEDMCKFFQVGRHATLKAVNHVSFNIYKGETVGLVGESGCGKSTTGRCIVKLDPPTSGHVFYEGKDIYKYSAAEHKQFTADVQMIFQNPYASLNPRMTVKDIVGEGMKLHGKYSNQDLDARIEELLNRVGLGKDHMSRFSHEFSGGQRQRIGIARALSVDPKFIICDEPISALDVSIQAQVINLFEDLQKKLGLTYVFIAHDLAVVRHISDDVGVMYLGKLVEVTSSEELYRNPLHPYTNALLSAIPIADYEVEKTWQRIVLENEIPSPIDPPKGCPFHPRCKYATETCKQTMPELEPYSEGHKVACHNLRTILNQE